MLSFFLLLLLLIVTVLVLLVLRKNQQKHAKETADRTAPLPALGDDIVPDFGTAPLDPASSSAAMDNWQLQVKNLRANQQYEDALQVCKTQFPQAQAIQQAAIILRQQIKINQENNVSFDQLLQRLYSLAALADMYSNGSQHKASAITQLLSAMHNIKEKYKLLGYQELKLLNKTDARLLEQCWGKPDAHRHAEEIYPP